MERYRAYGLRDDPALVEGDDNLVGVNSYDVMENVPPGQVQAATNMDFTSQDAVTRGGFVCLPSLAVPYFGGDWTSRTSAADHAWSSIAYGNGTFVAVNNTTGNIAMTSPTGTTWTSRTTAGANPWNSIAYGNGLFVAVASNGANRVQTSPDGITWTARTAATALVWSGVAYGAGVFVAVAPSGTGNRCMSSTDGITWVARTSAADNDWFAVTYGGGLFVAVAQTGSGNRVQTSPDGISWTIRTSAANKTWSSIAYGNGRFVAVASDGTSTDVMTSSDGITWVSRTPAATNAWRNVIYGNGIFVAVSSGGTNRIMASRDGINWTAFAAAAALQWYVIGYGNGVFVAVSQSGVGNRVMTAAASIVYAAAIYSDPNDPGSQWIMLVGQTSVTFHAFGRQSQTIDYDSGETVSEVSTVVQCNNLVYIFRGSDEVPLYWTGVWGLTFSVVPETTPTSGFSNIPYSNQATYCQDRLWVIDGKDQVAASDVLEFNFYDDLANEFNVSTGSSDFLVTTYPFGTETLVVFKNKSIIALTGVSGRLVDVVATEITRQVGCTGINAVCTVGPDLVYMSNRNINLLSLTSTSNALQHKTLPLSRNIQLLINRVNWNVASKVSMGYFDNKLYVALPLDNATSCSTVVVYNFVTEQWYGEWEFSTALNMGIQSWAVGVYGGSQRLHCITEDGRIFVTGEGQNDICGAIVSEIETSLTTRAYRMNGDNRINRRMWADLATNRPNFSVTAYVDGASEYEEILSDQTYSRATSWIFADSSYDLTNASDDYNRAFRQDYSSGPASVQCGTGFQPEMVQESREPLITRRKGRLAWYKIENATGLIAIRGIGTEARAGDRGSLVQVG